MKEFPSPVSPLSPAELHHLQDCIETANGFLKALSDPGEEKDLAAFRSGLRRLRGSLLRVEVECGERPVETVGCLREVGKDFLGLDTVGQETLILFDRICSIHRPAFGTGGHGHRPALIGADPDFKRELILRFGPIVSGNPYLISLFFGIPLYLYLVSFLGCQAVAETRNGPGEAIRGILAGSEEEGIVQILAAEEIRQVRFGDICRLILIAGDTGRVSMSDKGFPGG